LHAAADTAGQSGPPEHCLACAGHNFLPDPIVSNDKAMGVPGLHSVYSCVDCGSGTTTPFVSDENLGELYADDYASFQDPTVPTGMGWALTAARRTADELVHRKTPSAHVAGAPGRLLEIGCGGGRVGESYIARGWQVVGIEPSPQAAEMASRRGLTVFVGTLGGFEGEPEGFDAALFRHSLEHVVEPRADLAKTFGLLAPGGVLMIEIPNFGSWQRKRFKDAWFALGVPTHRSHFTDAGLRAAAESAGFDVVKTNTGSSTVTLAASVQYKLFDRWVPRGKLANILTSLILLAAFPITWSVNKVMGGGDVLRLVAVRPAA
jgi:SAM-dependent methyltransferase